MKIFALNLCLHFTWKHALSSSSTPLISYQELMNELFKGSLSSDNTFHVEAHGNEDFLAEIIDLQKNEVWRDMELEIQFVFASESACQAFIQDFRDYFSNVDTAGGLVENEKGEILVICHRNRWSLPKGHIEWLEEPEKAALREVKEETGLNKLEIVEQMASTYHTFRKRRKWIFKTTKWFKMRSSSQEELIPQEEEHISDIRWVDKESWSELASEAYPQIKHVLKNAFE